MPPEPLFVRLGSARYGIERPWGALPATPGSVVTDAACDAAGNVLVLIRSDGHTAGAANPRWSCSPRTGASSAPGAPARWRTGTTSRWRRMAGRTARSASPTRRRGCPGSRRRARC
ncbi:hypothetical protein GCM10010964_00820 [Caldovatus sediminis]|uniref:Uncharacterized protein n=1 Tax=Caldovatus sediminis TaxID=2041189 RepID=A0A8J3EBS6_9PROT|nr:hypothetical protein GCM10010964_00820 [Caldovatus sediminis]